MAPKALYVGKGGAEVYGQDGWATSDPDWGQRAYVLIPAGVKNGDLLVLGVVYRQNNVNTNFMYTPSGWINMTASGSAGHGGTQNTGSGTVSVSVFHRTSDGTEGGSYVTLNWPGIPYISITYTSSYIARVYWFSKPPDSTMQVSYVVGADTTPGTTWNSSEYAGPPKFTQVDDTVIVISGQNARYSMSAHQMHGNGVTFTTLVEVEDYDNGYTVGCRMHASVSRVTSGTASDGALWATMTASGSGDYAPAGISVICVLRPIPWPAILKRWDGSSWVRAKVNRWNGSSWIQVDNGVGPGKLLKKWSGSVWEPVSCLKIVPSPNTISDSTGNGGGFSISYETGHQVEFIPWETSPSSGPAYWISMSPSTIHANTYVTATLGANSIGNPARTAIIYPVINGVTIWDTTSYIAVSQAEAVAYADWDLPIYGLKWEQFHSACPGTPSYINVTSNTSWTITNVPSWLYIGTTSGTGSLSSISMYCSGPTFSGSESQPIILTCSAGSQHANVQWDYYC